MDPLYYEHVTGTFDLPLFIQDKCDRYYILHWTGEYFSSLYYKSNGRIHRDTVKYQVIFDINQTVNEILGAKKVILSFRRYNGDKQGYVIVRKFFINNKETK